MHVRKSSDQRKEDGDLGLMSLVLGHQRSLEHPCSPAVFLIYDFLAFHRSLHPYHH